MCLNPRFDGAFLNWQPALARARLGVLIPDLMGLF